MPKIRQLDPHVADLIAAGEVVERPASVVKELMENAIDAGASAITVEIQRGGMSYIRVTDDGCGIAPEDCETAFLRHATSKIRDETDLAAIGTLGFRGEALAAIAAVSHVELLTRRADDAFGTNLLLDAGVLRAREEVGGPVGTTMIVRDLFFNTPARLKFMKRDASEGAAVFAVVQHTALSHPETAVTFLKEGKRELQTPGDGQLKSAVYAVLGRDIALGYLPVSGSGEGLEVTGFISMPACCRGTRGYQHFFVNGRYVKSRTMTAALEEAYKNQKMVGKFPGCVLHISAKLNAVDVNVHPTKTEVKFVSDRQLFDAVYYSVKAALEGTAPRLQLELDASGRTPRPSDAETEVPSPAADQTQNKPAPARSARIGRQNFFQSMTTAEYRAQAADLNRQAAEVHPAADADPVTKKPETSEIVPLRDGTRTPYGTDRDPARDALLHPEDQLQETPLFSDEPADEEPQIRIPLPGEASHNPGGLTEAEAEVPWRIVGELFSTYILVEQGDKIILIDKHAAHERMNFDRLKAEGYRPMAQQLMTPLVFAPAAEESAVLLENLPLLTEFGFDCEDFGGGALIVRQIPYDIDESEAAAALTELAGKLLTAGSADPDSARDELMHTIACKAAIKGGQRNGTEELQAVAEAVMRNEVRYCPHGRPVAVELTRKQLEKQFKRIV